MSIIKNPSDIAGTRTGTSIKRRPVPSKAAELLTPSWESGRPEYVRVYKDRPEHYSGLSRSYLYDKAGKGLIRSVSIREPGKIRGVRLFHLQSILDFIASFEVEGEVTA